ncbi:hypothetical protein RCC89_13395 [Cytophagaceae bacterium ABcell3]|nr:hypothetical protein RCC89_13395 [Cytophagaceae bacterium ABcell3]
MQKPYFIFTFFMALALMTSCKVEEVEPEPEIAEKVAGTYSIVRLETENGEVEDIYENARIIFTQRDKNHLDMKIYLRENVEEPMSGENIEAAYAGNTNIVNLTRTFSNGELKGSVTNFYSVVNLTIELEDESFIKLQAERPDPGYDI